MTSFEPLADRLDAIAEEIAETALAELKQAVRRGEQKRPATERALTQARRAVEKAAHLLRRLDDPDDTGERAHGEDSDGP